MAEQYISIKTIHDRVVRHPLMQGVTIDNIVDYAVDFMRIVGVPNIFIQKVETFETHDFRVKLPCDYLKMIQMRGRFGVYHYATDTFHLKPKRHLHHHHDCSKPGIPQERRFGETCSDCEFKAICDNAGYDFNKTECISMLHTLVPKPHRTKENTYITQNSMIFLSNKDDIVDISYMAIMTDAEGYPMIPDNAKFERALTAYIKREVFSVLFDTGQINKDVMFRAEQDYAWAVGAASSAMHELDLPRLETISNAMHGIINKRFQYDRQFRDNGKHVVQKIH